MNYFNEILTLETGATLTGYLHSPSPEMPNFQNRPAILICPGGGYGLVSDREKDPVAFHFLSKGYQVFALTYSIQTEAITEESKPLDMQPLIEIATAMKRIRENHQAWGVISDQIAVCGFSAGAHLAGSLSAHYDNVTLLSTLDTDAATLRPDASILCYPVITSGEFAHRGSFENLLGSNADKDSLNFYSLEKQVNDHTPPTFLWHTVDDNAVPVENALLMACALQKHHVPFELHLYDSGIHGSSICSKDVNTENAHAASWLGLCEEWLDHLFH